MKTGIETLQTEFNLYTCKTCGQDFPIQVEKHFTTYGTDREGNKHCVECCGKNDLAEALKTGEWIGYLSTVAEVTEGMGVSKTWKRKTFKASNWPGTLSIPVYHYSESRPNIGRTRTDVWFKMPGDPFVWHGKQIGDNNQILRAKRTKKKEF